MSAFSFLANIALPGSGTVLNLAKRFGPYVLIALAAAGVVFWFGHHERGVQQAKDQTKIAYLTGARDGWRRNAVETQGALDKQSAAVKAMAADANARVADAHAARMDADKKAAPARAAMAKLDASAASKRTPAQDCEISPAVKGVWK